MPLLMAAAEMQGDNKRGKNYQSSQAKEMKGQTWLLLCIPLSSPAFPFPPCRPAQGLFCGTKYSGGWG